MELKYFMPTRVLMGKGIVKESFEEFKSFGKKALIVTGKNSSKVNGSLDDVIEALKKVSIDYIVFDDIEENPSVETVDKAASLGKENDVDFVIGIGGGSPIDASKAIAMMIKNRNLTSDNLFTTEKLESLDVISIPTTSGTGTEVTQYSIITDHKDKTKKCLPQVIFPKLSLLDPSYTSHMSVNVTINTAVDAFSHIVESYLNKNANLLTDMIASKALNLFGECIDSLLKGEFSYKVRENLMLSSTLAGIIIAQTGTSLPHGMGYHLTYFKNIPHGLANGCLYVEYLRIFKDREKVDTVYKLLGLKSHGELEEILNKLVKVDIDITEEEIREYALAMSSNKLKLKNHPEEVGFEEIFGIYKNSLL